MPWDLCYDVDVISTQPLLLLLPLAEVSLIRTLTITGRSQPKHFFTGKPWSHVDGPSFLSFKLSQDVMMFWNDSFPRFEDVTHPWSFRVKFVLPLLVYLAMVVLLTAIRLFSFSICNINWTLKSPVSFGLNCPLFCPTLRDGFE
ncbi:unnamed protein product [Brassica rapa subsp. narinosa]|uniref:(rape) hypothetical protein n=1 Tax=Brassica napus TaxID=3708 RepID=A0A816WFL3_BRANA|nr:unnamed protein product [Brassica napus]